MLKKLEGFAFEGITEELLNIDQFLSSPHPYEQALVKYIENDKSLEVFSPIDYLEHGQDKPIKVEGIDRLNATMFRECQRLAGHFGHYGYVSCHLFLSPQGSKSFTMHTDPDDVIIHMVQGHKVFESPDGQVELFAGDSLYIPRGTHHRAINIDSSIMLSFGLEQFLEKKL
ncbi:Cupin superfamily protein [compost metagenome]